VEPVTLDNIGQLKLCKGSYYTIEKLTEHIAGQPGLVWRVRGQHEYVIAGHWRHRTEIGQILELTYGRSRKLLLPHILDIFRRQNSKLVVASLDDFSLYLAFYAKFGFERLDEIIEMERIGIDDIPATRPADIRRFHQEDLDETVHADQGAFPWLWRNSVEEFSWYVGLEGVEVYVARDADEKIVGYSGFTSRGREGHLDRLAVLPDYQGSGYGAALVRFSVERMLQKGARRIALSTQTNNTKSQRLYRWFGFRPTFRAQKIYGLWLDGGKPLVG
jgi:ribosomal protein S18 acetylase RimI-like enzyme